MLLQPPGSELVQQTRTLSIQNVSPLPFTAILMCMYPFSFKNVRGKLQQLVKTFSPLVFSEYACMIHMCMYYWCLLQELDLNSSQEEEVVLQFDPTYCKDGHSHREESQLVIAYRQHPLRVKPLFTCTYVYFNC